MHEELIYTTENCLIIGSEIAALRAAHDLLSAGIPVTLINFSGELCSISKLLQGGITSFIHKKDIITPYLTDLESSKNLTLVNNVNNVEVISNKSPFELRIENNNEIKNILAKTIILATGFKPYKIEKIEEYGYGFLDGVITIFDLEKFIHQNNFPFNENMERIVFILCAGSRITRGNPDCSTYCCSYSINQALYIKRRHPYLNVVIMYMDIRTIANQEFLYNEARKEGIIFIRGRPSSIEQSNAKLITLFEDTLTEVQENLPADLIILAVGGEHYNGSDKLALNLGVQLNHNKFVKIIDKPVTTSVQGIFACGSACDGIKTIQQNLSEGGAAAMAVVKFKRRD